MDHDTIFELSSDNPEIILTRDQLKSKFGIRESSSWVRKINIFINTFPSITLSAVTHEELVEL
jgi:hypothetical protein